MRRPRIALRFLLCISSLSLLMCSAAVSWAQNQPPIDLIAPPVFDIAALHVPVSEAKILQPHGFSVWPSTILGTNKSQPKSQAGFFISPPSYRQLLIDHVAMLIVRPLTRTSESQSSVNYFIGGTPNRSFTFEPAYLRLSKQTINPASDMDYYDRIPFAGPFISKVAQQAEVHPRITRVLMTLRPEF